VSFAPGNEPTIAELAAELAELRGRVRTVERRLQAIEPETTPGMMVRNVHGAPPVVSESPVLDALGDALEAFGFSGKD